MTTRLAYTVAALAEALGVTPRTIYRMIARGELSTRRTSPGGGRVLIPAAEVDRWLVGERRVERVSPRRRKVTAP